MNAKPLYFVLNLAAANIVIVLFCMVALYYHPISTPTIKTTEQVDVIIIPSTPEFMAGKSLFRKNCASCHNKNMKDDMTGPALGGVVERWADYPEEDLYNWIRNAEKLIASNHPRATLLWKEWRPVGMPSFPALTDEDIDNLIVYIK